MTDYTPRGIGLQAAQACADKAERVAAFSTELAAAHIARKLRELGPMSGEDCVFLAQTAGHVPHDARAFGAVFRMLVRRGWARVIRSDLPRAKGRGTAGGRLYEAIPDALQRAP